MLCIYLLNDLNNKLDISLFFIMILHMYNLELFIKMDDITRGNGMTLFMEIFLNKSVRYIKKIRKFF